MEKIVIELKDQSKRQFLLELLKQFNFIELIVKEEDEGAKGEKDYDFFQSAGLLSNRKIDANQLRHQAWRISK